jgi:hypothetical protein
LNANCAKRRTRREGPRAVSGRTTGVQASRTRHSELGTRTEHSSGREQVQLTWCQTRRCRCRGSCGHQPSDPVSVSATSESTRCNDERMLSPHQCAVHINLAPQAACLPTNCCAAFGHRSRWPFPSQVRAPTIAGVRGQVCATSKVPKGNRAGPQSTRRKKGAILQATPATHPLAIRGLRMSSHSTSPLCLFNQVER